MSLTTQIKQLRFEVTQLQDVHNCPEYVSLQQELAALERRMNTVKAAYLDGVKPDIEAKQSDIRALKEQQKRETNPAFRYSVSLLSWFHFWGQGSGWGYDGIRLRWVSPNQNWAIITVAGGTTGQGTPMGTSAYYYSEAWHYLYRVIEGASHVNSKGSDGKLHQLMGRLTKAAKDEWVAHALANDEGCPFTKNLDRTTHGGYRVGDYVYHALRQTYGYIWSLSYYKGEESVSYRDDAYSVYPVLCPKERFETSLRLAKKVEEMGYLGTFEPHNQESILPDEPVRPPIILSGNYDGFII